MGAWSGPSAPIPRSSTRACPERSRRVVDSDFIIADLTPKLLEWERTYNTVRPHQALGYLTPQQFLQAHCNNPRKEVMCH